MNSNLLFLFCGILLCFSLYWSWPNRRDALLSCYEEISELDFNEIQSQAELLLFGQSSLSCERLLKPYMTEKQFSFLQNNRYEKSDAIISIYNACLSALRLDSVEQLFNSTCSIAIAHELEQQFIQDVSLMRKSLYNWQHCQYHPSGRKCLNSRRIYKEFIKNHS